MIKNIKKIWYDIKESKDADLIIKAIFEVIKEKEKEYHKKGNLIYLKELEEVKELFLERLDLINRKRAFPSSKRFIDYALKEALDDEKKSPFVDKKYIFAKPIFNFPLHKLPTVPATKPGTPGDDE